MFNVLLNLIGMELLVSAFTITTTPVILVNYALPTRPTTQPTKAATAGPHCSGMMEPAFLVELMKLGILKIRFVCVDQVFKKLGILASEVVPLTQVQLPTAANAIKGMLM